MSESNRVFDKTTNDRVVSYLGITAVMIVLAVISCNFHWQGTQQLHSLLELTATLTAFFVGVMALSMYRADTKQTSLLILSLVSVRKEL